MTPLPTASTSRRRPRAGFTLLELLVTITVMATVVIVIAPALENTDRLRLVGAADLLTSDLEAAQVMTIASPDKPVVVRFDPGGARYWLAYAGTPETPLARPDTGEPYLVELGAGRAASTGEIALATDDVGENTLEFNPQGGLVDFASAPAVYVSDAGLAIKLEIAPATGTIRQLEVDPAEIPAPEE